MRLKAVLIFLFLLGTQLAQAYAPLYSVKIASTKTFEVVAGTQLDFYPFSEQMGSAMKKMNARKIIAADYETGIVIKTKEPAAAIQEVLSQISRQTGLTLRTVLNTNLARIAPVTLVQAFSDTSVMTLLLTPKANDEFILTCAFVIDERPNGSIDGTPAAIAQLEESLRRMTADSIATSLPEKIAASELQRENYFRGAQPGSLSDPGGKKLTAVMVLLLKKNDDYTVGIYQDADGIWTMIEQPVALSASQPPYPYIRGDDQGTLARLRASKIDGKGGIDLYLDNGHIIKKEFSN